MMLFEYQTLNNVRPANEANRSSKPVSDVDRFLKQEGMDPLYIHSTMGKDNSLIRVMKSGKAVLHRFSKWSEGAREAGGKNPVKDKA